MERTKLFLKSIEYDLISFLSATRLALSVAASLSSLAPPHPLCSVDLALALFLLL